MSQDNLFLRYASPGERRMISREDLGFYSNIVVGATYEFGNGVKVDLQSLQTFAGPLKHCVGKFPHLKVVACDASTEKPFFKRVTSLDLRNHLRIIARPATGTTTAGGEEPWMEQLLESLVDEPNSIATVPPWRVVVCPISPTRCFVAFAYSHIIGDGRAALAFHRAFLDSLRQGPNVPQVEISLPVPVPRFVLPDPFDTPARLPISWSFLLGPLLAVLLPEIVAGWLGLQAHAAKVGADTWTGNDVFFEPGANRSCVRIFAIDEARVTQAVRVSRAHGAKLTGTIHQLVVRALSKYIAGGKPAINFVSQTAVSMRASIGLPSEEWGNFASGCYGMHPVIAQGQGRQHPSSSTSSSSSPTSSPLLPASMWENASLLSKTIAESATQLWDQPLGLLRYAPNIRKWLLAKVGGRRDCSYEVSNLTSFRSDAVDEDSATPQQRQVIHSSCKITDMVFAQPGGVVSAPMAFNLVSVHGGPLVGTITWGRGALGVPVEAEDALVDGIRRSLVEDFAGIGSEAASLDKTA
ncbi:uncharacterized protein PG998_005643 [Apiospora kogelbergensis]|uniref:uncharacterized protein n=1 Tax=Apiospora kogelbergensis TaxID=1337665 RepID=UPI003130645B